MKKMDLMIGFFIILLSVFTIYNTRSFPAGSEVDVGSAFFPRMVAYILIFLALLLIMSKFRTSDNENSQGANSNKALLGIVLCVVYLALIYVVGFYASSILFLLGSMWLFRLRKVLTLVLVASLIPVSIYIVFERVLQVPLPAGILF